MSRGDRRELFPPPVRQTPVDLALVVVLVAVTQLVVFLPAVRTSPLRPVFGLPFVLFAPGYALTVALFPRGGDSPADGMDGIERAAFSVGFSVATVVLTSVAIELSPWRFGFASVLTGLTVATLGYVAVATLRRRAVPEDERFRVDIVGQASAAYANVRDPQTRVDAILNVLVVVTVLAAVALGGVTAITPSDHGSTELSLLTETDDGRLVADAYPETVTVGTTTPLVVGVSNHEGRSMQYTLVVKQQRLAPGTNETQVQSETTLDRLTARVPANQSKQIEYGYTPTVSGERIRFVVLLYRGDPPETATLDNAYREVHLWVTGRAGG